MAAADLVVFADVFVADGVGFSIGASVVDGVQRIQGLLVSCSHVFVIGINVDLQIWHEMLCFHLPYVKW